MPDWITASDAIQPLLKSQGTTVPPPTALLVGEFVQSTQPEDLDERSVEVEELSPPVAVAVAELSPPVAVAELSPPVAMAE